MRVVFLLVVFGFSDECVFEAHRGGPAGQDHQGRPAWEGQQGKASREGPAGQGQQASRARPAGQVGRERPAGKLYLVKTLIYALNVIIISIYI